MQNEASQTSKLITGSFKVMTSTAKALFTGMGAGFKAVMAGMATIARGGALLINKALSAIAFIGIITLIIQSFQSLKTNADNVLKSIGSGLEKLAGLFQRVGKFLGKIPLIGGLLEGGANLGAKGLEALGGKAKEFGESLEPAANKARQIQKMSDNFKELGERVTSTSAEVGEFFKNMELQKARTGEGASLKQLEAMISSSGVDAVFKDYRDLMKEAFEAGPGFAKAGDVEALEKTLFGTDGLITRLATIDDTFKEIVDNRDTMSIDDIFQKILGRTGDASATTAAFTTLNSSLDAFQQKFSSIFRKSDPMDDLIKQIGQLGDNIDQTQGETVKSIFTRLIGPPAEGMTIDEMNKQLQELFGNLTGIQNLRNQGSAGLLDAQLASARIGGRSDAASRFAKEDIKRQEFAAKIDTQTAMVRERALAFKRDESDLNKKLLEDESKKLAILRAQETEYNRSVSVIGRIQDTFSKGIEDMFVKIAEGSMSAKEAFKSLATLVLQEMAKIAAMRMAASVTGFLGFANGGIMPVAGMASGGYMSSGKKRFGTGGVVTQPTYMVGEGKYNEAVVPLPDGRTIPVEMTGSGAGTNNVVINVDASGNASATGDGEHGKQLGFAIQAAVMETIQREKRPGGVLSGN